MKTTITLLAAGFAVSAAHAQIEYTAQDRWVEIQAFFPTGTQSDSRAADGFGLFDETLSATLSDGAEGSAWAYAAQTSSLASNGISVTGAADGAAGPPVGMSAGVGRTSFMVGFTLTEAAAYTLDQMGSGGR